MVDVRYPMKDEDGQIRDAAREHLRVLTQVYGDEIPWSAI